MSSDEIFEELREEILVRRDRAIVTCGIELGMTLICFIMYDLRRSLVIIAISVVLAGAAGVGLRAALDLDVWLTLAHAILSSALGGAYIVNLIFEAFLLDDDDRNGYPQWLVPLTLFFPLMIILICQAFTLMLALSLLRLREFDAGSPLPSEDELEDQADAVAGENVCCVCMSNVKDAALTPCGHKAVCLSCGRVLANQRRACPICRQTVQGVLRVFDS